MCEYVRARVIQSEGSEGQYQSEGQSEGQA